MWMRNHNLGTPPTEGFFLKNILYTYMCNVAVHSGPVWFGLASRLATAYYSYNINYAGIKVETRFVQQPEFNVKSHTINIQLAY